MMGEVKSEMWDKKLILISHSLKKEGQKAFVKAGMLSF
jgi:hypothetical protein